jgi:tRNA G46 methylase TrmB
LIFCNAATSLAPLLQGYPGRVAAVLNLHPDPWLKKKHKKRRILTEDFVRTLASVLPAGGEMLLQTDVEELMEDMQPVVLPPVGCADGADEAEAERRRGWWSAARTTTALEHYGAPVPIFRPGR